ncbi:hypothetical protein QE152_g28540 [Popillia japonica]|uniref:Craniofacial development protein 2-like n=1 Tax=Popillia japonica TaxID=7064 RepID=A0AAW1JJW3_POPJA
MDGNKTERTGRNEYILRQGIDTSNKKKEWKLGAWNVRSLHGKECELISEFDETGLTILCISETKMKGQWERVLDNDHILLHSGVNMSDRAAAGVGIIIHRNLRSNINRWEAVSERILAVEHKDSKKKTMTIISVYGPNDNDKIEEKEKFWEELTSTSEDGIWT